MISQHRRPRMISSWFRSRAWVAVVLLEYLKAMQKLRTIVRSELNLIRSVRQGLYLPWRLRNLNLFVGSACKMVLRLRFVINLNPISGQSNRVRPITTLTESIADIASTFGKPVGRPCFKPDRDAQADSLHNDLIRERQGCDEPVRGVTLSKQIYRLRRQDRRRTNAAKLRFQ